MVSLFFDAAQKLISPHRRYQYPKVTTIEASCATDFFASENRPLPTTKAMLVSGGVPFPRLIIFRIPNKNTALQKKKTVASDPGHLCGVN